MTQTKAAALIEATKTAIEKYDDVLQVIIENVNELAFLYEYPWNMGKCKWTEPLVMEYYKNRDFDTVEEAITEQYELGYSSGGINKMTPSKEELQNIKTLLDLLTIEEYPELYI